LQEETLNHEQIVEVLGGRPNSSPAYDAYVRNAAKVRRGRDAAPRAAGPPPAARVQVDWDTQKEHTRQPEAAGAAGDAAKPSEGQAEKKDGAAEGAASSKPSDAADKKKPGDEQTPSGEKPKDSA
jgi:hypothetical protein